MGGNMGRARFGPDTTPEQLEDFIKTLPRQMFKHTDVMNAYAKLQQLDFHRMRNQPSAPSPKKAGHVRLRGTTCAPARRARTGTPRVLVADDIPSDESDGSAKKDD